jgi:serine/threonine protein kinase
MGTPDYMAPEQAEGRSKDIGPAADIWALGGILYALLTGRPPFRTTRTRTFQDILWKVCHAAPISPRALCPNVPADLEIICLKCLEKRREDRYASARHLADDLPLSERRSRSTATR